MLPVARGHAPGCTFCSLKHGRGGANATLRRARDLVFVHQVRRGAPERRRVERGIKHRELQRAKAHVFTQGVKGRMPVVRW